jgi:hypothetical protein
MPERAVGWPAARRFAEDRNWVGVVGTGCVYNAALRFCVTVDSLNGALAWLTIEGAGGTFEAQLWFSKYGLPQAPVT